MKGHSGAFVLAAALLVSCESAPLYCWEICILLVHCSSTHVQWQACLMSRLHTVARREVELGTSLTGWVLCPGCLAQIGAPAPAVEAPFPALQADAPATLEAAGPSMMDSVETQVCGHFIVLPFLCLVFCHVNCNIQHFSGNLAAIYGHEMRVCNRRQDCPPLHMSMSTISD